MCAHPAAAGDLGGVGARERVDSPPRPGPLASDENAAHATLRAGEEPGVVFFDIAVLLSTQVVRLARPAVLQAPPVGRPLRGHGQDGDPRARRPNPIEYLDRPDSN